MSVEFLPAVTGGAATSRGAIGLEPPGALGPLDPLEAAPLVAAVAEPPGAAAAAEPAGVEPTAAVALSPCEAPQPRCITNPPATIARTIALPPTMRPIRCPSDLRPTS